jgi:Tfp pilus assembly protein PilN
MLWERWIPGSYLIKSSVCSIECVFHENGLIFFYTLLQSKKNRLEITETGKFNNLADTITFVTKTKLPLLITVSGKGIITKKVMFSENDSLDLNEIVRQHLPSVSGTDFYVQFYKNSNSTGYLAICRKELINDLLKQLAETNAEIVNVFIGSLIANAISVLTSSYNRVYTSAFQLNLVNGEVDEVLPSGSENEDVLTFENISIAPPFLISFAAGFGYLTRQTNYSSNDITLAGLPNRHLEKNKIRVLLAACIIFIFLVSVVNSVFFFRKFEESDTLGVELNLYESKNSQITQLLESYQKKENLIEQTGIFENKRLSVYADKLAASLPGDVVLRELYFNPEVGETEEDSLISFQADMLIIKGNCNKSLLLNEWVNVLKSQAFVKSVNLESFIYNSEGYLPNFILKLETK